MNCNCPCQQAQQPEPVMISIPAVEYAQLAGKSGAAYQQLQDWQAFIRAMLPDLPSDDMRKAFKEVFGIPDPPRDQWGFR